MVIHTYWKKMASLMNLVSESSTIRRMISTSITEDGLLHGTIHGGVHTGILTTDMLTTHGITAGEVHGTQVGTIHGTAATTVGEVIMVGEATTVGMTHGITDPAGILVAGALDTEAHTLTVDIMSTEGVTKARDPHIREQAGALTLT